MHRISAVLVDRGIAFSRAWRRSMVARRADRSGTVVTAKSFASAEDITEKKVSFDQIGSGLYAYTAEGDPNSGIVVGDDGVMVIDAARGAHHAYWARSHCRRRDRGGARRRRGV